MSIAASSVAGKEDEKGDGNGIARSRVRMRGNWITESDSKNVGRPGVIKRSLQ
jgi:hypothetical protein